MSSADAASATPTPLHDLHIELGARMVAFAGYAMPLQYRDGIIAEHTHTRMHAGLFDVSHMGQIRVSGNAAARVLEALIPSDVVALPPGRQCYSFFTNDTGGVLDDLIIANTGDGFLLIVNAARKAKDLEHLQAHLPRAACSVEPLERRALLALQGPSAARVAGAIAPELPALPFMSTARATVGGIRCEVSRSGYTGEDGFEISVAAADAVSLARMLLSHPEVAPAGLGARDSLRLEAGLCLYGQDLDASTTPVEAGLAWTLPRARRTGGERAGGYPGADVIARQLAHGVARQRVGLEPDSRVPVRAGSELSDEDGRVVGAVTSGGFGPTVGRPIAMGYVQTPHGEAGSRLTATVRGKPISVRVTRLPFVARRYHRGRVPAP
jgi:aminomethyltransferase